MPVALNHTIVAARDAEESAAFLSELMDLPAPKRLYHFVMVETANGVSLDYSEVAPGAEVVTQHYAFLVDEDEFDKIFGRIVERGLDHWADPGRHEPGRINHNDGGRGVYFPDPSGHLLEILTRPYGSGS